MNVIDIFSLFFMTVGYIDVQLLQNECPQIIAMVILGMTTKGKCDTVKREYTVANSK
jgi:hypothetical protein